MDNDEGRIEELQKNLYSREHQDDTKESRPHFEVPNYEVGKEWKHEGDFLHPEQKPEKPRLAASFFRKVLIGSAIFFILAAGVAGYVFYRGLNIVSAGKVNITFVGPVSIAAGDELAFDIVVQNDNNSPLADAVLFIDYPDGTKEAADLTKDLVHEKEDLGEIPAKSDVRRTMRSVLFGEEHMAKEIKVVLEYSVKNSNRDFRKEKSYNIVLSSAPLGMTVSSPAEISSGDIIEYTVDISSNSNVILSSLLLKAEYPPGFEFVSSTPAPTYENNAWSIPQLKPGGKQTFKIKGRLEGQEFDERIVRFQVGAQSEQNKSVIATAYLSELQSVKLHRSPISTELSFRSTSFIKDLVMGKEGSVDGRLSITNNMPTRFLDAQIKATFSGLIFDPASPSSASSIYRISDKTIVWDKNTFPNLAVLDPGSTVNLEFVFRTLPQPMLQKIKNGSVTVAISINGQQINDVSSTPQPIATGITRTIKLQTSTNISSRLVYASGPFKNTGPIPPKVDAKTTYTVIWSITNSSNQLSGASMKATVPPFVTWLGKVSPTTDSMTWDPRERTITWNAGDVRQAGTGIAREVAFQIEVQPLNTHIDSAPEIIGEQTFTAIDAFTGGNVSARVSGLTTALPTDSRASEKSGVVRK